MNMFPTPPLMIRLTVFVALTMAAGMAITGLVLYSPSDWFTIAGGTVVLLALALPLMAIVAKWVIHPLIEIDNVAKQLQERGELGPIGAGKHDGFMELGRTLTHLAARSRERIEALETEQAKVAAILNSMVEGVVALDDNGRVILMNPSARRILNLGRDRVEGQFLLEVIRNRGLAQLVEQCHTLKKGERCRGEVEFTLPVRRILEANAMQLPFTATTQGTLLVLHDITELRRLEQVRVEFVANVSHELRTPLTAIRGYLETLLDESPRESANHRRFLEVAHAHAERLGRLVNDLLSLSDIETGKVVLKLEAVCLADVTSEVAAMFENEASKKQIALVNEVGHEYYAHADRDRLCQILVNLVDNAVKYTASSGRITFRALNRLDGRVRLFVEDTGQGIPPAALPRITERFYRVDKARSRDEGGTGLGLAIVKHLVQLHGGTLHIDSEVGRGTRIEVTLPVPQLAPTPSHS